MNFKLNRIFYIWITLQLFLISCSNRSNIYSTRPNLSVHSFEFKSKGKFLYKSAYCLGSDYGYGKYEIIEDTVRFKFDSSELNTIVKDKINSRKDLIQINLFINEHPNNKPLQYCTIAIFREGTLLKGYETDNNGFCEITLPTHENGYEIQLSRIHMQKYKFNIDSNGTFDVKIDLYPNEDNRIIDEIKEFRLIELSDSVFSYSRFNDSLNIVKLFNRDNE